LGSSSPDPALERLLRDVAPQVLGAVVRRYHDFAASEDAVQEALIAATTQWPSAGVPDDPRSWLIRVAQRRMIDSLRSDESRRKLAANVAEETATAVVRRWTRRAPISRWRSASCFVSAPAGASGPWTSVDFGIGGP
jgi:predicted RNA polymerase sigma factor